MVPPRARASLVAPNDGMLGGWLPGLSLQNGRVVKPQLGNWHCLVGPYDSPNCDSRVGFLVENHE